jgi:hypothetical protein
VAPCFVNLWAINTTTFLFDFGSRIETHREITGKVATVNGAQLILVLSALGVGYADSALGRAISVKKEFAID